MTESGGFIHGGDPFADPVAARSPARRLRGRLVAPVTLWTAPGPAGLTVSSMLVADGEPGRVLGLLDEESELWDAVAATGRFAVVPLHTGEQQVADRFAGRAPAPGGPFRTGRWRDTDFGPVPEGERSWAGCTLDDAAPYGWALLVRATIDELVLTDDPAAADPLAHYRGHYLDPGQ